MSGNCRAWNDPIRSKDHRRGTTETSQASQTHTHTLTRTNTHTRHTPSQGKSTLAFKQRQDTRHREDHRRQTTEPSVKTHTPSTIIDDQLQGTTEKSGTITITIKDTHILESHTRTHTHRDTHLTVLPSTHITIKQTQMLTYT